MRLVDSSSLIPCVSVVSVFAFVLSVGVDCNKNVAVTACSCDIQVAKFVFVNEDSQVESQTTRARLAKSLDGSGFERSRVTCKNTGQAVCLSVRVSVCLSVCLCEGGGGGELILRYTVVFSRWSFRLTKTIFLLSSSSIENCMSVF